MRCTVRFEHNGSMSEVSREIRAVGVYPFLEGGTVFYEALQLIERKLKQKVEQDKRQLDLFQRKEEIMATKKTTKKAAVKKAAAKKPAKAAKKAKK